MAFCLLPGGGSVWAQTTQALISGRITNSFSGEPIQAATVTCTGPATSTVQTAATNPGGFYTLPLLPPGVYELEVKASGFQAQAQFEIRLAVASSLNLDFALRPLATAQEPVLSHAVMIAGGRSLLTFYGPDVDPNYWTTYSPNPGEAGKLEASISNAVQPADIERLPLAGNNIYSILLAEPGTSASNATTRSLGVSADGLRPSSSSFLLDGVETNFYLIGGPLLAVAPEAVQEYRLSTNNFSAEYGGAAGYIANAVTRAGGASWHGQTYWNLENELLNANGFQDNASGDARRPSKQLRVGYFLGGPLRRGRLFLGASTEYFRTRDRQAPVLVNLPNAQLLNLAGCPAAPSIACRLLRNYPVPSSTAIDPYVAPVAFEPPVALDRWLSVPRLDYSPSARVHGSVRAAVSHVSQPDFIWSPYPDYVSGLNQPAESLATNWTFSTSPGSLNQITAGWNGSTVSWNRAHPGIPTLVSGVGNRLAPVLPGSPAAYGLNDRSRTYEVRDEYVAVRGRHIVKFGGGFLFRHLDDGLSYGMAGVYAFANVVEFAFDQPALFSTSLSRLPPYYVQPNLGRSYREAQYSFFVQDTFRVSPRFTANAGLRYDNFGGPVSIGTDRDPVVQLGLGATAAARVAAAQLTPSTGSGAVYPGGNHSFAPRLGFSYELLPGAGTLLRGGFGVFYDRVFDNIWLNARNNSFSYSANGFEAVGGNYLAPVATVLPAYAGQPFDDRFPVLTAFEKPLPNGYAEDFFLGLQQPAGRGVSFELDGAGSLGRRLIATDVLNINSLENRSLPPIDWISAQGLSSYYSLSLVSRWRGRHGFLQAAWTRSHAIDEQSDPLAGDFFNLLFVNPGSAQTPLSQAGFSRSGDSRGDRGNADFDQRQSFVVYGSLSPVAALRGFMGRLAKGWTLSAVAAVRAGFPYTIYTTVTDPLSLSARARTANPAAALVAPPQAVAGGERAFSASAFCRDDTCPLPETSRNGFAGPGLVNLDLSAARGFVVKRLGEAGGVTVRADFFNALNHANLNPPGGVPGTGSYGIALFGTPAASSGFPALVPLGDTARRIQLLIRVTF